MSARGGELVVAAERSFFFQAEDGIRADLVTGVQTCALPILAALVRSPETARGPRVERLDRSPGVHYVLVLPLGGAGADVLTVGVGPRTRLIPAARVARFLEGAAPVEPPYDIKLSPPAAPPATWSARVIWTRRGWSARGERRLELSDGVHHVHLTVDLRDPWALLVRGVLVVAVDAGLLASW